MGDCALESRNQTTQLVAVGVLIKIIKQGVTSQANSDRARKNIQALQKLISPNEAKKNLDESKQESNRGDFDDGTIMLEEDNGEEIGGLEDSQRELGKKRPGMNLNLGLNDGSSDDLSA